MVSYLLRLKGISLTINTACSTSLSSIVEACKNLQLGACDVALAGGVSLTLHEEFGDPAQEGMIFSPDGVCRPFDTRACGTVRGSGCGVVVLKRLEDAIGDGDEIHAVIKGFAINNDGRRKVGYTAPSPIGQVECFRQALDHAEVPADSIDYIECHGTGTELGDAIEIQSLQEVYGKHRCLLGSVKANIGHADTAAGVASFIKACMMLQTHVIPPQAHFDVPNPKLLDDHTYLSVPKVSSSWQSSGPRRIGVSSFGIGGTNVHLILEEHATTRSQRRDKFPVPQPNFTQVSCWLGSAVRQKKEHGSIEDQIFDAFQQVLGGENLDPAKSFFELGGDSLSALQLAKSLSEVFGFKVSAATLFTHSSIEQLKDYWRQKQSGEALEPTVLKSGEL